MHLNLNKFMFIIVMISIISISGCINEDVEIKITQVIPITPTTKIEISKPISIGDIKDVLATGNRNYILSNNKFQVSIELNNNKDEDFNNVRIRINTDSDLVETLYPYSPSGLPLKELEKGYYDFGSRLLAHQKNELFLFGKIKELPSNLITGTLKISISIYNETDYQISDLKDHELKVCRNIDCN